MAAAAANEEARRMPWRGWAWGRARRVFQEGGMNSFFPLFRCLPLILWRVYLLLQRRSGRAAAEAAGLLFR